MMSWGSDSDDPLSDQAPAGQISEPNLRQKSLLHVQAGRVGFGTAGLVALGAVEEGCLNRWFETPAWLVARRLLLDTGWTQK
jgi:hypothetical protein